MAIRLAINMIIHHKDCNKGGEGIAGALLGHGCGLPSAGSTICGVYRRPIRRSASERNPPPKKSADRPIGQYITDTPIGR